MTHEDYIYLQALQIKNVTPEIIAAIEKQRELHLLADEKMNVFYSMEDAYRKLFKQGVDKLYLKYPEAQNYLPKGETYIERFNEIDAGVSNPDSEIKKLSSLMKEIDELVEAEKMNETLGQACFEYYTAIAALNEKIADDRKCFFTKEYLAKMDALADEGVFLYFLETPDYSILDEKCNADFVLDSFTFGNYISTLTILDSFFHMPMAGPSMIRKQEDIASAVKNMMLGFQRTAARNWFALIESEHKKCAEAMEGYFEKERKFKNGKERSKKIDELFSKTLNVEWESMAWRKIDAYYQKMIGKPIESVPNRNELIHGDYDSNSIDITAKDVIKIMLIFINLRLIADHFSFIEEYYQNKITMIPYFCKLFPAD